MVNDTTEAADAYVSAGDFPGAIRALQSLGTGAGRPDYKATIVLAREIRDRTAKGRERLQCDALIAHAENYIKLISHPEERVIAAPPSPFRQGLPVSTSNDVPGWEVTEYVGSDRFEEDLARYAALGYDEAYTDLLPSGSRIVYVDSTRDLPGMIELIEYTEAPEQVYDAIQRAAIARDGREPIRRTDR
jgi:hypothetical protein